jgi:hypothetical protein
VALWREFEAAANRRRSRPCGLTRDSGLAALQSANTSLFATMPFSVSQRTARRNFVGAPHFSTCNLWIAGFRKVFRPGEIVATVANETQLMPIMLCRRRI